MEQISEHWACRRMDVTMGQPAPLPRSLVPSFCGSLAGAGRHTGWHETGVAEPRCPPGTALHVADPSMVCKDGDVRAGGGASVSVSAGTAFSPEVLFGGKWYPMHGPGWRGRSVQRGGTRPRSNLIRGPCILTDYG